MERNSSTVATEIKKKRQRSRTKSNLLVKNREESAAAIKENSPSNTFGADLKTVPISEQLAESPNGRDQLVQLFFYSMLDSVIEKYSIVDTEEILHDLQSDQDIISKDFKDIEEKDMETMDIISAHDSNILFTKKSMHGDSSITPKLSRASNKDDGGNIESENEKLTSSTDNFEEKNTNEKSRTSIDESGRTISKEESLMYKTLGEQLLEKFRVRSWSEIKENEKVNITFTNGNVYEGTTSERIMDGYGVFRWTDGTEYKGQFVKGYASGKGRMVLPNLGTYDGEFCKGTFHGKGVFNIICTPIIYCGEWKNGKKHGNGWLLYEPNNWYDGEWFLDQRHGIGTRLYKNSIKYHGQWQQNCRNGQGSMFWKTTSDFYKGNWTNGVINGFGEYTWNTFLNKSFVFPLLNSYKGSWDNGLRTGAGLMQFGLESGAKLAGIWERNFKHGPGIIICGNGLCLQRQPLFMFDKPVHYSPTSDTTELYKSSVQCTEENPIITESPSLSRKSSFQYLTDQINSKVAMKKLDSCIIGKITKSGMNLSKEYIKCSEPFENVIYAPLHIPIHTIAENVNLNYYIELILNELDNLKRTYRKNINKYANEETRIKTHTGPNKWDMFKALKKEVSKPSIHSENSDEVEIAPIIYTSEIDLNTLLPREQMFLRGILTRYLPKLTKLYQTYATIASEKDVAFKTVMIRMFLWQLYRDIDLPAKGVSLVESDLILAENPNSYVESDHKPFEHVYFWQFIQSLVGTSWLIFLKKDNMMSLPPQGKIAYIFKMFLDNDVFPNIGKRRGSALFKFRDLVPFEAVYQTYLKLGEPHSARHFLYHTCTRVNLDPPCHLVLKNYDLQRISVKSGINITGLNQNVTYFTGQHELGKRNGKETIEKPDDNYFGCLFCLRHLGVKTIVNCLAEICTSIKYEGAVINMEYNLTFLEFYEILLLCADREARRRIQNQEKRRSRELQTYSEMNRTYSTPILKTKKNKGKIKAKGK